MRGKRGLVCRYIGIDHIGIDYTGIVYIHDNALRESISYFLPVLGFLGFGSLRLRFLLLTSASFC